MVAIHVAPVVVLSPFKAIALPIMMGLTPDITPPMCDMVVIYN
jgi:hypothetical protein